MLMSYDMKKTGRSIIKTGLCCVSAAMMIAGVSSKAEASSCYHHYNSQAWHGAGTAIVFCLDSGVGNMAACDVYRQSDGKIITSFYEHSGLDHGRQVFTDPNTDGPDLRRMAEGGSLVIVCKDTSGNTYSYPIGDGTAMVYPGVCGVDVGYIGGAHCRGDGDPLLTVKKGGVGKGTVVGDPTGLYGGGIDCGTACTSDAQLFYADSDQTVMLTATPAEGYVFVRWQGSCVGTETSCIVKMTKNRTVTAVFDEVPPEPPVVLTGPNTLLLQDQRERQQK